MTEENPWQTLSSEVRYENPWIKLTHHEVINPRGGRGIYGAIHYKNLALGIIPLDQDGNTWLVGQFRYVLRQYSWEIPEGGGDPAIEPLLGAQRELKEETGIEAGTWRPLLVMDLSNSVSDERATIFLATDLSFGDSAPEDTEELVVRKLPFMEAYDMVLRGEITDSISVAGILRLKLLMDEGGV